MSYQLLGKLTEDEKMEPTSKRVSIVMDASNGGTRNTLSTESPSPQALLSEHTPKPAFVKSLKVSLDDMESEEEEPGLNHTFLRSVFEILVDEGLNKGKDLKTKVIDFKHPSELKHLLDLEIGDEGDSNEKLLSLCKETFKYSVRTGHPHFFNQLFAGIDEYGLAGAWLSETVNTSQYTFEVAPVFTLMEHYVLGKMRELVGFEDGDGIFCPGGSISNMYGMSLARHNRFPGCKLDGMAAVPKICLFTSKHGHYSIKKAACLLGIGINAIKEVPVDERGKMSATDLRRMVIECKKQGYHPFFVNATSGTTVMGAYDSLEEIAEICEEYRMWMHVDCCWGGGVLLSKKHKNLMKGVQRADSLAWNPHKMMGSPLQCCAFLTRHNALLHEAHSASAKYLFQQDKFYDVSYDTGDKSIQCGRKVDVFKLWLMWRAKGNFGFENAINNAFDNTRYLVEKIKGRNGFRLVNAEPECTNVCFWYIPPSLRGKRETEVWWNDLSRVAPAIKKKMVSDGTMLIGYQPLDGKVNFFRMVISNLELKHSTMDFMISEIERLGKDL